MTNLVNHVFVKVTPEARTRFLKVLLANAVEARKEEGCLQFHVSESQENPNSFLFYEVFTNEAALEAHRDTPYFKDYLAMLDELGDKVERGFSLYDILDQ